MTDLPAITDSRALEEALRARLDSIAVLAWVADDIRVPKGRNYGPLSLTLSHRGVHENFLTVQGIALSHTFDGPFDAVIPGIMSFIKAHFHRGDFSRPALPRTLVPLQVRQLTVSRLEDDITAHDVFRARRLLSQQDGTDHTRWLEYT